MDIRFFKYLFILLFGLSLYSCRQAKYVPDGYHLLKENNVHYTVDADSTKWKDEHRQLDEGDISDLIRPETNSNFRLFIFNRIDTARYQKQVIKKRKKHARKQAKHEAKVEKKNQKRIKKAKEKGQTHYKHKTSKEKSLRLGWRHWVIDHWGEEPVILDTAKISKSKQQMQVYLSQRGFKYATVTDSIEYLKEKKRKVKVHYYIESGKPYVINSITFDPESRNSNLIAQYKRYKKNIGANIEVGDLLDEDKLDDERDDFTKFLKDNAYFGFTKNYINFIVDTTNAPYKADLTIYIKEKQVPDPSNPDTTVTINHTTYYVNEITYKLYNPDSLSFNDWESYKKRCVESGYYDYKVEGKYVLLDTVLIIDTIINKHFVNFNKDIRKKHDVKMFEKFVDTLIQHKGYFLYNEEPFVRPDLLDKQNFLEHSDLSRGIKHFAKDYYIDRTYKGFLRLDIFSKITPTLKVSDINPLGRYVDVTYELMPTPKQQFTIEPRATNTASILGVSGQISYTNKNLNRNANKMTISVEGGLQSQPLFASADQEGNRVFAFRGLNTFEIGPEITYKIPKFFPMSKNMQANISKRAFPSTEFGALYNFQRRPEFKRHVAELSYRWEFSSADLTQIFTVTPIRMNYVFLNKQASFDSTLQATNDPFLINSYSDFFSIGVLNFKHEYNNQRKKERDKMFKRNHIFQNTFQIVAAGLIQNTIDALVVDASDFVNIFNTQGKTIVMVPFAQYAKMENTFIFNQVINQHHRMAYRLNIGVGYPYGNGISLPYSQSFVGGGSNDIRAFDARTMAPGGTQTWNDANSTETQIGDMKLMLNLEWRFNMGGNWNGAIFMDAGNIWKLKSDDPVDPGLFKFNRFMNQVAIGTGFGIRYDLSFLIARVDFAWALHNPYLPAGARWWLRKDADAFANYQNTFKEDGDGNKIGYQFPHLLNFNVGIGYPF